MTTREKASRRASVRNSMEVKQGRQGLARMLRRGLHGAKGWVLEPDEDGSHRTVGSKAFRAAVVFLPGWIVLSAFTSQPSSGQASGSGGQAIVMALFITIAGLAFFSARERRLGREEPWAEGGKADEAEDSEVKTIPFEVRPEEGMNAESIPVDLTKPQVTEVTTEEEVVTTEDNQGEKDHFDPPGPEAVTPAVTPVVTPPVPEHGPDDVFDQVSAGMDVIEEVVTTPVTPVVTSAETEIAHQDISDSLEEETPTVRTGGGHPPEKVVTPEPEETSFSQVSTEEEVVTPAAESVVPVSLEKAVVAESPSIEPEPVTSVVTQAVTQGPSEPVSPQVEADIEVVTRAVTPVVTRAETLPFPAEPGPYPVTGDPMEYDWWATPPDVPGKDPEETPEPVVEPVVEEKDLVEEPVEEEPAVQASPEVEEVTPDPEPEVVAVDEATGPEGLALNYPPEVVTYLALKRMPNAPKNDKERARAQVISWVKKEGATGRSQRQMAAMLGVSKTTVLKWMNGDPWADEGDQPE